MTGSELELLQTAIDFISNFNINFAIMGLEDISNGLNIVITVWTTIMLHMMQPALKRAEPYKACLINFKNSLGEFEAFDSDLLNQNDLSNFKDSLKKTLTKIGIFLIQVQVKEKEMAYKGIISRTNRATTTAYPTSIREGLFRSGSSTELMPLSPTGKQTKAETSKENEIDFCRVRTF